MLDSKVSRLDEIAQLCTDLSVNLTNEVIRIMTDVGRETGGLDLLIERYAGSSTMVFPRTIGYLLARRADDRDPDTGRLMVRFLDNLGSTYEVETLTNGLTALQFLNSSDSSWNEIPRSLVPFLSRCLNRSTLLETTVCAHALLVINLLIRRGCLKSALDPESASVLRDRLMEIWSQATDLSKQELLDAIEFLETYLTESSSDLS